MSFVGFENLGQQFAPLADAQLKMAYQDYQAQKDLNNSQRLFEQDKQQAQEAAIKTGYDSPLVQKVDLGPQAKQALGYKEAAPGEDPEAHMRDFYDLLDKQYPGSIDMETRKVHPSLRADADALIKAQRALELKASELANKKKYDMELLDKKQKNAIQIEGIRSKNIASRIKSGLTAQQKQIIDEINILTKASSNAFTDPEQKMQIQAQIEALKFGLNNPGAAAPAPRQQAMAREVVNTPVVDNAYQNWLAKHGAKDTAANKAFFQNATKAK